MTVSVEQLSSNYEASQHLHLGIAMFRINQFNAAVRCFDAALALNPADTYARYNRATALLSLGNYTEGFPAYEAAWRLFHWRGFGPVKEDIDRLQALPQWKGERTTRLLLYHEMGFGDAIMAMRWLPELKRRAGVTLVIDPCLARLARSFDVEVIDRVPDDLSGYDCRLPFFGVMAALGVTADNIPTAPYIEGNIAPAQYLNRIGIAWMGRTQTAFTLERFLSMLAHSGYELHSLLPGPMPEPVISLPPGSDFADVVDRIAAMDHIVSVDTAAIHLAGAMGHRSAHLLLPYLSDWRWHHTARWYPSLKTYRQQEPHDWATPFANLNEALHGRV